LAVDPARQRTRAATALVSDSLRWLALRGAHHALVNTQRSNRAALSFYERLGFVALAHPLVVLRTGLEPVR
jgi:ribosomal protein S18 acetylase RimI-like enzyme